VLIFSKEFISLKYFDPQDQQRYIYRSSSNKEYNFSSRRILASKSAYNCRILYPDYTGYFADISIGVSHLNSNIAITRTELGEQVFLNAVEEGYLELSKFNFVKYFLINFMGKKKRENNRSIYEKLF
jgi:coenzyme F420-reducing hydrogenase beta subunit